MMFKCIDCGHIFEEGEEGVYYDDRGEFWGVPCRERIMCCPVCYGDYDEAVECERCGEWFYEEELTDGLCKNCREETEDAENG